MFDSDSILKMAMKAVMKYFCSVELMYLYTEKKMLLNQKHFFPKACIPWI